MFFILSTAHLIRELTNADQKTTANPADRTTPSISCPVLSDGPANTTSLIDKPTKTANPHANSLQGRVARSLRNPSLASNFRLECVELRIQDMDITGGRILVMDGKGRKDRTTLLSDSLKTPLQRQIDHARFIHQQDLFRGYLPISASFSREDQYAMPTSLPDSQYQISK
jgi:hypothetical protein